MPFWRRPQRSPEPVAATPCRCPRHLDAELLSAVIPYGLGFREQVGDDEQPTTVRDLLDRQALSVGPNIYGDPEGWDSAPLSWCIDAGDDVACHYDDDAPLQVDDSLRRQPGIEGVDWYDREVLLVAAPTLCAEGVLAAAATALLDPEVRIDHR